MVKEAIDENAKISKIVICEDCINDGSIEQELLYEIAKHDCIYVSKKVFESISEVINPQGILAVVEKEMKEEQVLYDEDVIVKPTMACIKQVETVVTPVLNISTERSFVSLFSDVLNAEAINPSANA